LQSNEDQRGIRAEGDDEFIYPLLITKEVPPLKEVFVDLLKIIKEKTESQEHHTISKKRFPALSEVFHEDGFFFSHRHIFPRFCFGLGEYIPDTSSRIDLGPQRRIQPSISALPDTSVSGRETLSKADGLRFKIRKVLPQSLFGILGKAEVQAPHLISPEFQA
jgi:hypothetical protein